MENATKALLIAAAILVAIIIISLGLAVVRQGQEAVGNADMSEAEMEAFNAKFKPYEGTNLSASEVNSLLSAVLTHNQKIANENGSNFVEVTAGTNGVSQATSATSTSKVSGSARYTVTLEYSKGLVNKITISQN